MSKVVYLSLLFTLTLLFCCVPPHDPPPIENPLDQPPQIPTGFIINTTTVSTITISWNAVSTADSYCLYRDSIAAGAFTDQIYTGGLLSFADTNLAENAWYYYKIQAVNVHGSSSKSSTIAGKTKVNTDPPAIPQNIHISNVTSTSMTIGWDSSTSATSYQLYRATSSPTTFIQVYNGPSISYTNGSLTSGQTYFYKVRAARDTYYSDYSTTVSASTLGPPATPSITFVGDATTTSLYILWDPVLDANGYRLYQAAFDDEYNLMYSVIYNGTATEFISTGLHIGWKYYYMVSAYNDYGESIKSSKVHSYTSDGEETLHTTYNSVESHTYFDADTGAYRNGTGTVIYTEIYDDNNGYIGSDFNMIFIGTHSGTYSGAGTMINFGLTPIQSTSCTIHVTTYGNVGERITGTFTAILVNGKTLTGDFNVIRSPDN